ncbi:universal stress protein [Methanobacterium sp.]|uniref:universal stress protein n=1 Tax=Methanobacterium sp. TaxID=2164 RepID=UPI003C715D66
MYRKILLPTDGSESAKRAGEQAISLADVTGADIIVLSVIDVNYLQPSYLPSFREDLEKELRNEGKRAIGRFKKDLEDSQSKECVKTLNSYLKSMRESHMK